MTALLQIPHYPLQFWLAAVVTAVLIGVSKAGFGGGPGVIATPLLSLVMPVPEAAALLLPILLLADVFAVRHYYDQVNRPNLRAVLPWALLGIALGALFFRQFSDQERVLELGIGLIALGFVLYQAVRSRILQVVGKTAVAPHHRFGNIPGTNLWLYFHPGPRRRPADDDLPAAAKAAPEFVCGDNGSIFLHR